MGGEGPFIAELDCDIDGAVNSLIVGFCLMQGEVCCTSTPLFLHEDIYDEFMEKLVRKVKILQLGDTMDPSTQMGSLISKEQLERVDGYVQEAVTDGARIVCGGEKYTVPPHDKGNYYEPTILENIKNTMRCAREEIFGPVFSLGGLGWVKVVDFSVDRWRIVIYMYKDSSSRQLPQNIGKIHPNLFEEELSPSIHKFGGELI